jgi:tRNA G18 (ribose-2'-O)-methylase SpoU
MAEKQWRDYKKQSRGNWGTDDPETVALSMDQINCGAILRIADAAEAMAVRHTELIDRNKYLEKRNTELAERRDELYRSIYALKGHLTKMRNKLKNIKS